MLKGQSGDLRFTFQPTGDFDGILTLSCPQCEAPKSLKLSDIKADEIVSCACGAQKADIESFRQAIREEVIKLARDTFKGILN